MSLAEKWIGALTVVAVIATATLPGRQTPAVFNAATNFVAKPLGVAMGTTKA